MCILMFPCGIQSWDERFLGTFEGFGSCNCYKCHWPSGAVHLSGLWYRWCSMGNNGVTSMLNEHSNLSHG